MPCASIFASAARMPAMFNATPPGRQGRYRWLLRHATTSAAKSSVLTGIRRTVTEQVTHPRPEAAIPERLQAFVAEFDGALSRDEYNSPKYSFRLLLKRKQEDAKHPGKGYGVEVQGAWYWYQSYWFWVDALCYLSPRLNRSAGGSVTGRPSGGCAQSQAVTAGDTQGAGSVVIQRSDDQQFNGSNMPCANRSQNGPTHRVSLRALSESYGKK